MLAATEIMLESNTVAAAGASDADTKLASANSKTILADQSLSQSLTAPVPVQYQPPIYSLMPHPQWLSQTHGYPPVDPGHSHYHPYHFYHQPAAAVPKVASPPPTHTNTRKSRKSRKLPTTEDRGDDSSDSEEESSSDEDECDDASQSQSQSQSQSVAVKETSVATAATRPVMVAPPPPVGQWVYQPYAAPPPPHYPYHMWQPAYYQPPIAHTVANNDNHGQEECKQSVSRSQSPHPNAMFDGEHVYIIPPGMKHLYQHPYFQPTTNNNTTTATVRMTPTLTLNAHTSNDRHIHSVRPSQTRQRSTIIYHPVPSPMTANSNTISESQLLSPTSDTSTVFMPSPTSATSVSPPLPGQSASPQPPYDNYSPDQPSSGRVRRSVDDFNVALHSHGHHQHYVNTHTDTHTGDYQYNPHIRTASDDTTGYHPHTQTHAHTTNDYHSHSNATLTHHKRERGKEIMHIATAKRVFQVTEFTESYDESSLSAQSSRRDGAMLSVPMKPHYQPQPHYHQPPPLVAPHLVTSTSAKKSKRPKSNFDHIAFSDLKFHELIGEGSFGQVYRGTLYGQEVAIKKIRLSERLNFFKDFKKEVKIMKALRHPNIVEFLGACMESPHLCLVTEYLSHGSLENMLKSIENDDVNTSTNASTNNHKWSLKRIISLAKDIARGLNWLHHKGIIHRDLKSANILLDNTGKGKICDFGLSHVKQRVNTSGAYGACGSLGYMAPEVLKRQSYGVAADIFSFGVCLCELLLGKYPYEEGELPQATRDFEGQLLNGLRPIIPAYCPKIMKDMIEACFSEDPNKRPAMEEITNVLVLAEQQLSANESHSMFDDCPPQILEVIRAQRHDLDVLEASSKNNSQQLLNAQQRIQELEAMLERETKLRKDAEAMIAQLQAMAVAVPVLMRGSSSSPTQPLPLPQVAIDCANVPRPPNSRRTSVVGATSGNGINGFGSPRQQSRQTPVIASRRSSITATNSHIQSVSGGGSSNNSSNSPTSAGVLSNTNTIPSASPLISSISAPVSSHQRLSTNSRTPTSASPLCLSPTGSPLPLPTLTSPTLAAVGIIIP